MLWKRVARHQLNRTEKTHQAASPSAPLVFSEYSHGKKPRDSVYTSVLAWQGPLLGSYPDFPLL